MSQAGNVGTGFALPALQQRASLMPVTRRVIHAHCYSIRGEEGNPQGKAWLVKDGDSGLGTLQRDWIEAPGTYLFDQ